MKMRESSKWVTLAKIAEQAGEMKMARELAERAFQEQLKEMAREK